MPNIPSHQSEMVLVCGWTVVSSSGVCRTPSFLRSVLAVAVAAAASLTATPGAAQLPPDATYRHLQTLPFDEVKAADGAAKAQVQQRQQTLLTQRYDIADRSAAWPRSSSPSWRSRRRSTPLSR